MKKTVFYVGLNDKDARKQLIDDGRAFEEAARICFEITGGATIYPARGVYRHDDGEKILENTLKIECFGIGRKDRAELVLALKEFFNQESIAVNVERVRGRFE